MVNLSEPLKPFSIDTRTLQAGDLFVALDGAHQKGFSFLAEAFRKGASAAIADQIHKNAAKAILSEADFKKVEWVENPVSTMASLARAHRDRFQAEMVGITGSVGKTSTKEFLSYLLGLKFNLLATQGNLNNHLGLPISLSRFQTSHQVGVFEMGANHVGDIAELVNILSPTRGILVPIGPAHLEGFGSLEKIYDAKLEILQAPHLKTLVTVEGDPLLEKRLKNSKVKIIRVGFSDQADVRIGKVQPTESGTAFELNGHPAQIPVKASFLAINAALAAALAAEMGVSWREMEGLWNLSMPKGRFFEKQLANGVTVIDDTYNASPRAVIAAIRTLKEIAKGNRAWLVFSDMLELGGESERLHREIAQAIQEAQLFGAWAFGAQAKFTIDELKKKSSPVQARWFEDSGDLADNLLANLKPGDYVLLKGSRGMRVEKVLENWEVKLSPKRTPV